MKQITNISNHKTEEIDTGKVENADWAVFLSYIYLSTRLE